MKVSHLEPQVSYLQPYSPKSPVYNPKSPTHNPNKSSPLFTNVCPIYNLQISKVSNLQPGWLY